MSLHCDCPRCLVYGPDPDNYGRDTTEKALKAARKLAYLLKDLEMKGAVKRTRRIIDKIKAKRR